MLLLQTLELLPQLPAVADIYLMALGDAAELAALTVAEQLRSASPDFAEVTELDEYAANAGDARQFAGAGQLQEQRVDYLESPQSGRRQR